MSNIKNWIRHELLNILSGIQALTEIGRLTPGTKKEVERLIVKASQLIVYEDLLLGKQIKISLLPVEMKTLLEIIKIKNRERNIQIQIPKKDCPVKGSDQSLTNAIGLIINTLSEKNISTKTNFDAQKKILSISTQKKSIPSFKNKTLKAIFSKKNPNEDELAWWLAMKILSLNKTNVLLYKNEIQIKFAAI